MKASIVEFLVQAFVPLHAPAGYNEAQILALKQVDSSPSLLALQTFAMAQMNTIADCFGKPERTQNAGPTTGYRASIFREIFDEAEVELVRTRPIDATRANGAESTVPEGLSASRPRNLKAARSESWPWAFGEATTKAKVDTSTNSTRSSSTLETACSASRVDGFRNPKAARSESWPWALEQASTAPSTNKISKRRSEPYIDILHRASLSGFPAPPRHEIHEYQQKPLPTTPSSTKMMSLIDALRTTGPEPGVPLRSKTPSVSGRRVDSFLGLNVAGDGDERKRESMLVAENFGQQGDDRRATWISRVQRRAESNQKAHAYLQKRE